MSIIESDVIQDCVESAVPDCTIESCEAVDKGTDIVYRLTGRCADGPQTYFFKTVDQNHISAFISEPLIQERIAAETSLLVPPVVETGYMDTRPYIIMEGLSGDHPTAEWGTETLYEVAFEMGAALGSLHDTIVFDQSGEVYAEPKDGSLHVDWKDSWADLLDWSAERMLTEAEPPFDDYADDIVEYYAENRHHIPDDEDLTCTIMHGDYRFDNVLFERHGESTTLSGVLDWGRVVAGDRRYNLDRTAYLISRAFDTDTERDTATKYLFDGYNTTNSLEPRGEFSERTALHDLHVMTVEFKWFSQWYANKSDEWKADRREYLIAELDRIID